MFPCTSGVVQFKLINIEKRSHKEEKTDRRRENRQAYLSAYLSSENTAQVQPGLHPLMAKAGPSRQFFKTN